MIGMDIGYEAANAVDDAVAGMWLELRELNPDHPMLRFLTDVQKSTVVVPFIGGPDFVMHSSQDHDIVAEYNEKFEPENKNKFWKGTNRRVNYFVALRGAVGEITGTDYSKEAIQRV